FGLLALGTWFALAWKRRGGLPRSDRFLWLATAAGPAAVAALLAGWIVTEVGRQPWIVYEVMRVSEAVTAAPNIRFGYYALVAVYCALSVATVFVLRRLAARPLAAAESEAPQYPEPVRG
ncbi:MAG: cytochrome ubiquinol oxidase subunit I, partial [Actinomycetota bacterium]